MDELEHGVTIATTGSMSGVRDALGQIRNWLVRCGLSDNTCGTVEIVLAEAMNNIVEHAYGPDKTGPLDITARIGPDDLQVTLLDQGRTFPDNRLPLGNLPDNTGAVDDLPEGGFGWFLIRDLTESIHYSHNNGKNRLILVIRRNCL